MNPKYILLLLWLPLLAGCDDTDSIPGDGGTDADTDADADTDTDADTDADTDPLDCAGGRYDESTNLCWQDPKVFGTYTWQEAVDYCEELEVSGHTDWTLPSREDFVDLLDGCDESVLGGGDGYCDPCADSETCNNLFGPNDDLYWSSSLHDSSNAWRISFYYGFVVFGDVDETSCVRCVYNGE